MKVNLLNDIRPRWSSPGGALLLLALLLMLPKPALALSGSGTSADPYLIATADDWNSFATKVSGGETTAYAKITADINLGEGQYSGMIGTESKPYSGTFDGQGHTVTVNYTTDETKIFVAPFRYISGATIKNLNTAGTFTVANKCAAGIVGDVSTGASTIENCRSSVKIVSSVYGDGTHGGLIAQVHEGGTVSIKDCIFDGSITGSSTKNCGGFIGWVDNAGSTITNCIQAGTFSLSSSDLFSFTFARHSDNVTYATITNSYYLNSLRKKNAGATKVTATQLSSGELAYALQASHTEQVWGQTLTGDNKDATPVPTTDASKRVYIITYKNTDGDVLATQYSNPTRDYLPDTVANEALALDGKAFTTSTTISQDVTVTALKKINPSINDVTLVLGATLTPTVNGLPEDYKGTATYTSNAESVVSVNGTELTAKSPGEAIITASFAATDTYNSATTTFKVTVFLNNGIEGKGTVASPYLIKTAAGWNDFAQLVALGNTKIYVKLVFDINLGNGTYDGMIGTDSEPYAGVFDGQGHTLTVNYTADQNYVAPFRYISGATIKNLTTAGTFNVSNKYAAGIAANITGAQSKIEKCRSSVDIVSSVSGDGTHGGLVALVTGSGSVAITDCIFDGSITGSSTSNCGGIIGYTDSYVKNRPTTISNCLVAGTFSIGDTNGSNTFTRKGGSKYATVSNSYYLNALGTVNSGATQVTEEQLSSGEVAYKLQAGRSEQVWGQTLTGDNKDATPVQTTDGSKRVYKITYQYENGDVLAIQYSNATMENLPDVVAKKTLTLNGATFTASTTISQDVTVTIEGGENRTELKPTINDATLDIGATLTPTVNGLPEGYNGTVTYTSGNESVISVNGTVLTGKAVGEATITATFEGTGTYKSATTTFKVTVSINKADLDGEGTEASPYLIKTTKGWNDFAQLVALGKTKAYAKLANDIEAVSTMVGTSTNMYGGTFDGDGHTLNVSYNSTEDYTAPFRYVDGATFRNLHVTGTITTTAKFAGGLIGRGKNVRITIEGCDNSVTIESSVSGDGTHGGYVGNTDAMVIITNSRFSGAINGANTSHCGGFIGWISNATTFTNCLLTASFGVKSDNSCTFFRSSGRYPTIRNCYYKKALGTVQGTAVTDAKLASGEVAWNLQKGQSTQAWGQTLTGNNKDTAPVPTTDASKRVYKVVYKNTEDGIIVATQFANSTGVSELPEAVKGLALTLGDQPFTATTTLSKDTTVMFESKVVVIDEDKDNIFESKDNMLVVLRRTFAANTWNTLVLPFSLTTDEVNTAFGSDAKVAKFTNNTANTIELNYDETGADKAIEANTPVLIRVTSEVANPTFSKRDIVSSDSPQVSGSNGINFIGSYAASYTIQNGEYFISGDKLWKSQGSSTIKATRAYFTVPAEQQAKLAFSINGDVVTGIGSIQNSEFKIQNSGAVYNLSGQKVADSFESHSLPKGIYIVNGKKVTVK